MDRYAVVIEDGSVYVETDGEPLEIGTVEEVVDLVGGESYDIVYEDEYAHTVDWLDLDEEDSMTIDVLETLSRMDYPKPFVDRLEARDGSGDPPERAVYFADVMTAVWDHKGNLDHLEENPFR